MSNFSPVIPPDAQVVFVCDLFVDDYVGGAELTTEALIESCPFTFHKVKSQNVTMELLAGGADKFWIFGNFSQLNFELIPSIVANLKYAVLEYDYKFCQYRSPEKHEAHTKQPCDCHTQPHGQIVSAFYYGAQSLWWMSERQLDKYTQMFPFLSEKSNIILSSVFNPTTLGYMKHLRESAPQKNDKWIVLGSSSWVKGADAALEWCRSTGKNYEIVWGKPYNKLLETLSRARGFAYTPAGADTCPRMVIEAKLLGCELHLNDNVQHSSEEWFATGSIKEIEEYLYAAPELFWASIRNSIDHIPRISGYTTTLNCIDQKYPFERSIMSMLSFCDEVCVVDGGSTDGTWAVLENLAALDNRIKVKQVARNWNHPRFAVYDGEQKAEARKMCVGDFCWQMDADEIVPIGDCEKVKNICAKWPAGVELISLPIVEYWGSKDKVRVDVNPWKWRLSRNLPHITHGIPAELRRFDSDGNLYAAQGTDGCDYINVSTHERIQHLSFYNRETHNVRMAALNGDGQALASYQAWMQGAVQSLPSVQHYSWIDITRKIKTYKKYWQRHWESLYNLKQEDTVENNMFFDKPWSEVTDQMIEKKAIELKEKIGGWVWHRKWSGENTPHITIKDSA